MDINYEIELLQTNRNKLTKIIDASSKELLFEIPKGFNNNIIWHIGHCVVSQQRLIYMRSNLPMHIPEDFNECFKIGTSPLTWTEEPDLSEVRKSLLVTVDKLNEDLKNNIFKSYEPMKTSMGLMINNHLQALTYANFHEAGHTGNIQYLIKILKP